MALTNAKQLHHETAAILNEVENGASFQVERRGKIIATILPAKAGRQEWKEIMEPVWSAQKKVGARSRNPVLQERARRRR